MNRLILQLNEVIQVWQAEAEEMDTGRAALVQEILDSFRDAIESS